MSSLLLSPEKRSSFERRITNELTSRIDDSISVYVHSDGKVYVTKENSVDSPWDDDKLYDILKDSVDLTYEKSPYKIVSGESSPALKGATVYIQRDGW